MKVAVMGAGLSGLSCAITLEKHGITPSIFEKRNRVGDRFINGEAMFSILNRPLSESLNFLSQNYGIELTPIDTVRKLIFHSKNKTSSIDGELGYTNIRGRHQNSYECQLERQVRTGIYFNSSYDYKNLCKEFDYVVMAVGDGEYSSILGNYNCHLTCTLKGATVRGEFVTSIPHVWFNYDILPKGYAYLIPYSKKEANLVMAYPDYPDNIKLDTAAVWDRFFSLACKNLDQTLRITDTFEVTRYMMGICNRPIIDNTYFVGNCFGTISPGLGFGQFASMLTGIYCAQDLCGMGKYEELVRPLAENYNHSLTLRRYLEGIDDNKLDSLIGNLDNKFANGLIDGIFDKESNVDLLKDLTPLLKLMNGIKNKH